MSESNMPAVVAQKLATYGIQEPSRVKELLQTNLGGTPITPFSLDKIPVPGAGGAYWSAPTIDGQKPMNEMEGVILHIAPSRRYYATAFDTTTKRPPECKSADMIEGIGEPGGFCAKCPMNAWGTGKNAKGEPSGKACKEYRLLAVKFRESGLLPTILVVPPTSLGSLQDYVLNKLTNYGLPFYGVVTKFTLKASAAAPLIEFAIKERLEAFDPDWYVHMKDYIAGLAPILAGVSMTDGDVAE